MPWRRNALATDGRAFVLHLAMAARARRCAPPRAQADRVLYRAAIRWVGKRAQPGAAGRRRLAGGGRQGGGRADPGRSRFRASAVVLTAGTFLDGKIHVGLSNYCCRSGWRSPAVSLSARLKELELPQGRLKTGTPPRLDGHIDYSKCRAARSAACCRGQRGRVDAEPHAAPVLGPVPVFSFMGNAAMHPRQVPCWITHTESPHPRHHPQRL